MSQYPDHLQLHLRTNPSTMANNKKQKKQRAAAAAATTSSSNSNQKKQPATAPATPSSVSNQRDQKDQEGRSEIMATASGSSSGSRDSIMSTIIRGIKGFTIDSAESIILKNDKSDFPSDQSATFPGEPADQLNVLTKSDTLDKIVDKGKGEAKTTPVDSENDLDGDWEQVDIHGRIKDIDTDANTKAKDTTVTGISKGKGKAKASPSSLEQDDLDQEWEPVEAENSLNDNTVFTLDADRQLCILWFFTTHSFSTMASLLNYSLAHPLPVRIHGQDAKDRFLKLAKSTSYTRAYVYYDVKRLSVVKNVDYSAAVQSTDHMFAEAWARMQQDLSEERELDDGGESCDDTSDAEYRRHLSTQRLWDVSERKALHGMPWGGLSAKVTRPEGEKLGSCLGLFTQGWRAEETMRLGKKKGWMSLAKGLIGL